jgi:uracil-DNA glycosylase family 4
MTDSSAPLSRQDTLAMLRWLIDAGADEAILDTPLDRFAARAPAAPQTQAPVAAPQPRVAPAIAAPQTRTIGDSAETVSLSTAPGAARALAASCTTLAELKHAVENFAGGELKRQATRTVFSDGAADARIMFIGEAPGRDEDAAGVPFVGRAGKLLDRMLTAMQLDRRKVYITNVLPWRPLQNRDPSPEEAAICLPFLRRQIEILRPEVMILLGAVSARHVLGVSDGIMRLRGKWDMYQLPEEGQTRAIPVMPTLHPAYLLRQPLSKRLVWRDLLSVAEKIQQLGLA